MQETQEIQVPSLGQEDPLEEGMTTYSSIHAWKMSWTKEPDGLYFMGLQRIRHDLATDNHHHLNTMYDINSVSSKYSLPASYMDMLG